MVSILLTAVFTTGAFWFVFANYEESNIKDLGQVLATTYNTNGKESLENGYHYDNVRVTLIDAQGNVLYDNSSIDKNAMQNHSDRPEFVQALKDGEGSSNRMSETFNSTTYYYAVKTDDGNVLRVSKSVESLLGIFIQIFPTIIIIIAVVFVICAAMSRQSTRRLVEPIENMTSNNENTPYVELEPLTETISSQRKEIRSQIKKLQLEKDKIDTLIQNMSEGFILIDMDKNVLMINHSATKFIGAEKDEISGGSINEYSRNETVIDCVESAINGEGKSGDMTIKGRILQIITNPVYSNGRQNGVICLMIDVSAKKKAEKMRREFTANVTHELKTPLTSISGYAEIIASGLAKPDDIQGFAGKIHKESGRLLTLIGDIMELSKLDERSADEDFTEVDLSAIAYEVAEDLRANAEKSDVTITVEAEKTIISGIRNQLYELIYNLCDNAIRYNLPQGSVKISIKNCADNAVIKVSDTGIGIPEKHHKRIFERFYRVDKSRSKETGGTGLGLAIVKHIAEFHGGKVTLESSESGTTFTITF